MAIPYLNIARALALKTGQLADAQTAALFETVYTSALATAVGGMEIPLSEIKRMVLAAEKRVADVCCRQKNPILKQEMYVGSVDLDSGDEIQEPGEADEEWIGTFDGAYDSDDDTPLTEKPKQAIIRMNRRIDASELRLIPHHFALDGRRLYHTRPNGAYVGGYQWSMTERIAAYAASGDSLLNTSCEAWVIAEACSDAAQEGFFVSEAAGYANFAQMCKEDAVRGVIPSNVLPDATASIEPVKN